jgi:hypothetical protein
MDGITQPQSKERPHVSQEGPQVLDSARSLLDGQKESAANSLEGFAGALRRAAGEMGKGEGGPASRVAEAAADNLQRFSRALREKDFESLVRDAESFARRQPAVFLGAAAVAGFLAVRFLKSSSNRNDRS